MSGSDRSERSEAVKEDETDFWTVCGYFLILVFMASLPFLSNDTSKQRHSQYAQICAADGVERLSLIQALPGYIGSDKETQERRKETNWCDLASQEKVANSAKWSTISAWAVTILTLIGVIFLARTLIYTRRTLYEAREAANSAKEHVDIAKAEQRAWIDFKVNTVATVLVGEDPPPSVAITCTNLGKTIAIKGYVLYRFHDGSSLDVPKIKEEMIESYIASSRDHGFSWIPNVPMSISQISSVNDDVMTDEDGTAKERVIIGLAVLVGYRQLGNETVNFTFKNYNLFKYGGFQIVEGTSNQKITAYDSIQEDSYRAEYT